MPSENVHTAQNKAQTHPYPVWKSLIPGRREAVIWAIVCVGAFVAGQYVTINVSPSVPRGLYRKHHHPTAVDYGTLVVVPISRKEAAPLPWYRRHIPLLKPVVGLPGDLVCANGNNLQIIKENTVENFGFIHSVHSGQPIKHIAEGCGTIFPGYVFVATPTMGSFDSRYWGAVRLKGLMTATPLWIWE